MLALALALAALGGLVFAVAGLGPGATGAGADSATDPHRPAAAIRAGRGTAADSATRERPPESAAHPLQIHPLQIVQRADTASQAYRQLLPLAGAGDVLALMAVTDLVGYCYFLFDESGEPPGNDSPPGSREFWLREQAMERRQAFCDDPAGHAAAGEQITSGYQARLDRAATAGDEVALASRLFLSKFSLGPDEIELAIRIGATTSEPEALQDVILALADSSDPRISQIEREVFNSVQDAAERDQVVARAAEWAACANGRTQCGRFSHEADSDCIHLGECYAHLTRMEYLRTRAMSGQHFEQMQHYLALLDERLLRRGQWRPPP